MKEAKRILTSYEREHKRLASALLEYETLTAAEIRSVVAGNTLEHLIKKSE